MNRLGQISKKAIAPKLLLVVYAVVDLTCSFLRTQISVAEAAAKGVDLLYSPLYIHRWADSLLLLVATVGLQLSRPWSCLVAIGGSGWVLFRGLEKWKVIEDYSPGVSMNSWSVMKSWWTFHGGEWDFPRLLVGIVVLISSLILLIHRLAHKNSSDKDPLLLNKQ